MNIAGASCLTKCKTHARAVLAVGLLTCSAGVAAQDEYTVLVFGDSGTGDAAQRQVAASMAQACSERGCDAAFVLGDLLYPRGATSVDDPRFTTHFEVPYAALGPFPFWMAPGNHDHRQAGSVDAEIAYGRSGKSLRWRMPAAHYSVEALPAWLHVYSLDTQPIADETAGRAQADEARAALCGKPGWRLLVGHHPIHSNGSHGDDTVVGGYLDDVIRECGVQAYFAGHDHHQEHISAATFEQFVQGAAAKLRRVRTASYSAHRQLTQRFARSVRGFAIVAFTERSMDVRFFDGTDGRALEIYRCRAAVDARACLPQ